MDIGRAELDGKLISRLDLSLALGLPERHPLVGLFHRFGGLDRLNAEFRGLAHLDAEAFVDRVFEQLGIEVQVAGEDLARIPDSGPFILVSNHPFGVLDTLALLRVIRRVRPDFKLGVESMLGQTPVLSETFFVVSKTRIGLDPRPIMSGWKSASSHLASGGGFGVFPAGKVSGFNRQSRVISDGKWSNSVVAWTAKQGVPVVPVYIDGANSRLFQLLGLIHPALGHVRMAAEIRNKKGSRLGVRVGRALPPAELLGFSGTEQLARFLRARCYALGAAYNVRKEYFRGIRKRKRIEPLAPAVDPRLIEEEVEAIGDLCLFRQGAFDVYLAMAHRIPNMLDEIGRCREATFRAVGEGTNRAMDLDEYDFYYQHLILWDRESKRLAGAYRVGEGSVILERFGVRGFYTHTLFRMKRGFEVVLGQSLELGRSFVHADYQRQRLPLFLLWKGILSVLLQSPGVRFIIGPVSISSSYEKFSRSLIMAFVRRHYWDSKWAEFIRPRKRFAFEERRADADILLDSAQDDVKRLDRILADIEPTHAAAPVLLKKYLRQNARILGFNRDPLFNDALDGLMLLDINDLPADTVQGLRAELEL